MGRAWRLVPVAGGLGVLLACVPDLPIVDDPCGEWPEPGLYGLPLDGFDRTPYVYVPAGKGPRGGVIVLHAAGRTAREMMDSTTRFRQLADAQGFVAVFPNGSGTPNGYYWNAGPCCGAGVLASAPDVAYLDAASQAIRDRVCVDHVVGTGESNGGMMAARWACEGEHVDGILTSAGPLLLDDCPGDPMPVVVVQGLADVTVPADGGPNKDGLTYPTTEEAFQPFLDRNQCTGEPDVSTNGDTTCRVWSTCQAQTELCFIEDWRHVWPGGKKNQPSGFDAETVVLDMLDSLAPTPGE